MNFWSSEVLHYDFDVATLRAPGPGEMQIRVATDELQPGDRVTVGIRPEHVVLGSEDGAMMRGRIELIEQLGESHFLYVRTDDRSIMTVRAPGDARHRIGETVALVFPVDLCHVFDAFGRALARW
jgi:multiple sugar transport system ATP-binding protein